MTTLQGAEYTLDGCEKACREHPLCAGEFAWMTAHGVNSCRLTNSACATSIPRVSIHAWWSFKIDKIAGSVHDTAALDLWKASPTEKPNFAPNKCTHKSKYSSTEFQSKINACKAITAKDSCLSNTDCQWTAFYRVEKAYFLGCSPMKAMSTGKNFESCK